MILVFWSEDCKYGSEGKQEFATMQEAEAWMNDHIQYKFEVFQGVRLKIVPVLTVKQVKLEKP